MANKQNCKIGMVYNPILMEKLGIQLKNIYVREKNKVVGESMIFHNGKLISRKNSTKE